MSTAATPLELNSENASAARDASTPTAAPQQILRVEPGIPSTVWSRFLEPYLTGAEPVCVAAELPGGVGLDELFGRIPEGLITREFRSSGHRITLLEATTFAAVVERWTHNNGAVTVRAATREAADKGLAEVNAWFPVTDPPVESVSVDFWQSNHGMYTTSRTIDAPAWAEVTHYYPGEVSRDLSELMALELGELDGRVILWHGPPGTGKTSAIRALARAWRGQARFQVVLDPEPVFSHSSSLMEVILDSGDGQDSKWRVLVIEDADDIVRADNARTSQSLSRLLNVGDGIVGQGLKVLVLLTTNEPPARLHPALTRPGRCLSHVAFRRFSRVEAIASFPDDDRDLPGTGDLSLAEILTGRLEVDDTPPPGQYL